MMKVDDEEIFAMKAGEELDKKIASELMDGMPDRYSEDLYSAWKVMKKLEEMGWRMDIMSSINGENVGGVLMSHGNPISFNYLVGRNVESDSLPEAICRAALLIVNNSQRIADLESKF